jgi:hypothetical protein
MRGIAYHLDVQYKVHEQRLSQEAVDLLNDEETAERERRLWPPSRMGEHRKRSLADIY